MFYVILDIVFLIILNIYKHLTEFILKAKDVIEVMK